MIEELLTLDDIAAIYKKSYQHARDVLVKQPGFPDIVPGTTARKPRWLSSDVWSYIRRNSHKSRTEAVSH